MTKANIAHAERAHALLSASSSKQWLACPPSARLSERFPDTQSDYAAEGTLAHEMAELALRKAFVEPMSTRTYNSQRKKLMEQLNAHSKWDQSMPKHVEAYVDYIAQIVHQFTAPPHIVVEKRIDYSDWAPEGFGTCDCLIVAGDTLFVIDFKFGKGVPVSAEENSQMRIYALGAHAAYAFLYPVKTVHMAIVQPRMGEPSEERISVEELLTWGESIKPRAQLAYNGEGTYAVGDHCRFCRAKSVCRARTEHYLSLESYNGAKSPILSNAEIGSIIERAQGLAAWAKSLEEHALNECLAGNDVAGWKAVEGRKNRDFVDLDAAFNHLKANGIDEAVLYDRKPLTAAQLEKALTKPIYRELLEDAGHVKVTSGKPTLAPANDKREAISNKMTAEQAFSEPIGGIAE